MGDVNTAYGYADFAEQCDGVMTYSDEVDESGMYQQGGEMILDENGEDVAMVQDDLNVVMGAQHRPRRAVHQCSECNKIFVSFKGLQQHSIIHTDQKPFACEICGKAFRFKSNLFEHRSVHSGQTPHVCPFCGKTCRLKGNLKKHLKTHVQSKEELDDAWRPFASNRRPPPDIPHDAIIVRSTGDPTALFTTNTPGRRPNRHKLGLGKDPSGWINKIKSGEILEFMSVEEKLVKLNEVFKTVEENGIPVEEMFSQLRILPLEYYNCPMCQAKFMSHSECSEHLSTDHPMARLQHHFFCEVCLKRFECEKAMQQHHSYHEKVKLLFSKGDLQIKDPEIVLPEMDEDEEDEEENTMMRNTIHGLYM